MSSHSDPIGVPTTDENRFDLYVDESEAADVYVTDVYENGYGDCRAKLGGDTYEAKDIIKFDWETTHHEWEPNAEVWIVDEDSLDELADRLAAEGFTFDREVHDLGSPLFDLHRAAEEGQTITVEYEMKNGNGLSTYSGEIVVVDYHSGWENCPQIAFHRDDDGQYMYIQFNTKDQVCLYTGRSAHPFVGVVTTATLEG